MRVLVKKQHFIHHRVAVLFGQLFCVLLLGACAGLRDGDRSLEGTPLPPEVANLLRQANIAETGLAVYMERLADGRVVASRQADRAMTPASAMKVVTSAVALTTLGPVHRGRTELRTDAPLAENVDVTDGVLRGNLVVQGFGDVDFSWRDLDNMLRKLRVRGIREIAGDVIIDRSYFSPARLDIGVPPFDDAPEFPYNTIPDALNLNSNLLEFDLRADAAQVRITTTPVLDNVRFVSMLILIDGPCEKWEDGWKLPETLRREDGSVQVTLQGTFPRNCATTVNLNVIDRADYAAGLITSLWRAQGGTLRGRVREGNAPPQTTLIAEHRARPLAEVIRDINKRSDNLMTRLTFLSLGARAGAADAANVGAAATTTTTLARAETEVRNWLAANRIATDGLVLENGSGLSRLERLSARQLAGVLRAVHRSKWEPEFLASLPIASVDGTMRNRLKKSQAAEIARLKTGTLRDASALAGFAQDASGALYIAVVMLNDDKAGGSNSARAVIDAYIDWLARATP
jgi:serine-type D-Ala-D-Ala carboxypeptidase/endopeptidase (penicillin-binding protein 4)